MHDFFQNLIYFVVSLLCAVPCGLLTTYIFCRNGGITAVAMSENDDLFTRLCQWSIGYKNPDPDYDVHVKPQNKPVQNPVPTFATTEGA